MDSLTMRELFIIAPVGNSQGRLVQIPKVMFGSATTYPFYLLLGAPIVIAVVLL